MDIRNHVAVVNMGESSVHNSTAEILAPSGVAKNIGIQSLQLAIFVDSNFPSSEERVSLTRRDNVFVTVQHTPYRPFDLVRCDSTNAGQLDGSCLFTAEPAAKSLYFGHDLICLYSSNLCNV